MRPFGRRAHGIWRAGLNLWLVAALMLPPAALAPPPGPVAATVSPPAGLGEQRFFTMEQRQVWRQGAVKVNVASGNLLVHQNLFTIRGTAGLDLRLDLYYNGLADETPRTMGRRWSLNYGRDVFLETKPDGSIIFHGPSGYQHTYQPDGSGGYTTPSEAEADLRQNVDGTFTLTFRKTAQTYTFTSQGWFTKHADQNGNTITLAYNADGTLATITDTQQRVLTFSYTGTSPKLISRIQDPTGRAWTFSYTNDRTWANTVLNGATGPGNIWFSYGKDTSDRLTQINGPVASGASGLATFAWDSANRLTSLSLPDGAAVGFTYNSGTTAVRDENGHDTTYAFDSQGRVTQTTDALGHSTQRTYTSTSNVQTFTDALGKITLFAYDAKDNLEVDPLWWTPED